VSWQNAKFGCEKKIGLNGHLVIIESQAENEFLKAAVPFINANWWIGASKLDLPSWHWIDGSPLTFADWAPGQPDDNRGGENCAELRSDYGPNLSGTTVHAAVYCSIFANTKKLCELNPKKMKRFSRLCDSLIISTIVAFSDFPNYQTA
jgi:hypothetical protein